MSTWKTGLRNGVVYKLHIVDGFLYISRYTDNLNAITRIPLNNPEANEELFAGPDAYGAFGMTDADNYCLLYTSPSPRDS